MSYPKSDANVRPYRLWHANKKVAMRWRYYTEARRAHNGALLEVRWAKVGDTIEVYNANTGRMLGQYTLTATSIRFSKGD